MFWCCFLVTTEVAPVDRLLLTTECFLALPDPMKDSSTARYKLELTQTLFVFPNLRMKQVLNPMESGLIRDMHFNIQTTIYGFHNLRELMKDPSNECNNIM